MSQPAICATARRVDVFMPSPLCLSLSSAFAGGGRIRSLAGGTGLPRLDPRRLRSTWLRDCAQLLGLATFMHAAGITCSQRLGDLLAGLAPADDATAVALL